MKIIKFDDLNNQSEENQCHNNFELDKKRQLLLQKVLRYLGIRARSRYELESYLKRHNQNIDTDTQAYIFKKIDQFNLVNDPQFATDWARALLKKGKGPVAIKHALRVKGIAGETISQVISSLKQNNTFDQPILHTAQKKLNLITEPDKFKRLVKLRRFLYTRGYSTQQIQGVIDELGLTP